MANIDTDKDTKCNYPLSIFLYNSILNYEYINKSFLFDIINHTNFIIDVPYSIIYSSLYSKYISIYDNLKLPWTFNQIVELYMSYKSSQQNSEDKTPTNNQPVSNNASVISNKASGFKEPPLEVESLPTRSFFPNIEKGNIYYISQCEEYIEHVTTQITNFKSLDNSFNKLNNKILKGEFVYDDTSDENNILKIIHSEYKLQKTQS